MPGRAGRPRPSDGTLLTVVAAVLAGLVAVIGPAAALWTGTSRRPQPWILAASLGITFNVLARSHLGGMLGASAIVGMAVACFVFVVGTSHLPTRLRRVSWGAAVA